MCDLKKWLKFASWQFVPHWQRSLIEPSDGSTATILVHLDTERLWSQCSAFLALLHDAYRELLNLMRISVPEAALSRFGLSLSLIANTLRSNGTRLFEPITTRCV
jgi:hypothetical protein